MVSSRTPKLTVSLEGIGEATATEDSDADSCSEKLSLEDDLIALVILLCDESFELGIV